MDLGIQESAPGSNNFSRFDLPLSFFFDMLPFRATRWASAPKDCSISIPMIPKKRGKFSLFHYIIIP